MYRINDKNEATRRIQEYLRFVGTKGFLVFPNGVYDEDTRQSVIEFQKENGIAPTGVVDKTTFDILYDEYVRINRNIDVNNEARKSVSFPVLPGDSSTGMIKVNRDLGDLLNRYGYTHNISRIGTFYSNETSFAIQILRDIYLLDSANLIDEEFFYRMYKDIDSINVIENFSEYDD